MTSLHSRLLSDYATLQGKQKSPSTREASIRRLQRLLAPHLPSSRQSALDLGAGQGELVEALQRLGFSFVSGVELSISQVKEAQAHGCNAVFLDDGLANLRSLPDQSLDLVCCFDVFEHLSHTLCASWFDQIHRVLRPDGHLIGHVPNGLSPFCGAVYFGDLTHRWCPVPESIRVFCRISGLQWIGAYENIGASTGMKGKFRSLAWRGIRAIIALASTVETGRNASSCPWSRTFLFVAKKHTYENH
jgi:SAM-dependent methyltransferase